MQDRIGLMTDAGRAVIPDREFSIDNTILEALKEMPDAWEFFQTLPDLYIRVRIGNIQQKRGTDLYDSRLAKFVEDCRKGRITGNWNDNGKLMG